MNMTKAYEPWYMQYPNRFEQEKADMAMRGFVLDDEALHSRQRVEFSGPSSADPVRTLLVKYPDEFPSFPPRVYDHTPGRLLTRHHQPSTREICLFGPGQPRWSAALPGTAALDEAESGIQLFHSGAPKVEMDHIPEPASALFPFSGNAAVLVPPELASPASVVPEKPMVGTFRLRFHTGQEVKGHFSGGRGIVLATRLNGQVARAGVPYTGWFGGCGESEGTLLVLSSAPPFWETSAAFMTWLQGLKVRRADWMAFVFPEQSEMATKFRLGWLIVRTYPYGPVHCVRTFPYQVDERQARVPGLTDLASKTVVMIGCGSMGSKLAVALAASGVNRFGLVDGDCMKPANSVRHELGVDWFGVPKVSALANRLVNINPTAFAGIERLYGVIGGDNPGEFSRKLHDMIARADLVIDTTGSHSVSRWVNDICHDLEVPALFASVTNGAWSGEVVRVIPGETACWRCWFVEYERDLPPSAPVPPTGVFAPGCEQPTFTGATHEVGIVANLAVWMAVETLLRHDADRPRLEGDYLRWEGRTREGAPALCTRVLQVHKRGHCPVCNPE